MSRNLNWKSTDLAPRKKKSAALRRAEMIEDRRKADVLIGVDPGTHTGIAVKRHLKLEIIETLTIFEALNAVIAWKKTCDAHLWTMLVRIEDARLRTYFGKTDREKLQGAGSIKRDCAIWEEVLTELQIPFEFVHPRNVKATTAEYFKKLTGWEGRTSIHAREAAFLIL